MNEQRSCLSAVVLLMCIGWAALAWLWPVQLHVGWPPSLLWHKIASVTLATCAAIHLFLAVSFERTE